MKQKERTTNFFLTYRLGEEIFGSHVSQVLNILDMMEISQVPQAPEYMKGIVNYRGKALPLIDPQIKFDMPGANYTYNTCIVVMELQLEEDYVQIGAIVDKVESVIEIKKDQIEPSPNLGFRSDFEFIDGLANVDNKYIMLLNMNKLMSKVELKTIAG
jgi:purine-binding chemotaxis protein CheW